MIAIVVTAAVVGYPLGLLMRTTSGPEWLALLFFAGIAALVAGTLVPLLVRASWPSGD